jgi:hypothetical protein
MMADTRTSGAGRARDAQAELEETIWSDLPRTGPAGESPRSEGSEGSCAPGPADAEGSPPEGSGPLVPVLGAATPATERAARFNTALVVVLGLSCTATVMLDLFLFVSKA